MAQAQQAAAKLARADRILPGIWRLRLPLPWPAVPHVNAFALTDRDGVVLFDCGYAAPDGLAQLEFGLAQIGFDLSDVRLLVCTHAHADHYGLSDPVTKAAGCELWMHPNHAHVTVSAADPDATAQRRLEIARASSVPKQLLDRYADWLGDRQTGIARAIAPDRELRAGDRVTAADESWVVYEAPGHAPSHIVLHEPKRGLLVSGDHLLGRVSLYFDYGYTPDPVGEFLSSLELVAGLKTKLCLAGHGRPFRDVDAHISANKAAVSDGLDRIASALRGGAKTPFELITALLPDGELTPMVLNWYLSEALCLLTHLEALGHATRSVRDGRELWQASAPRA